METEADIIAERAVRFRHDPLGWVKWAYDWGHGELEKHAGPRTWQAERLAEVGEHLRDPAKRHTPLRIAVASGHGIGKAHPLSMPIETPDGPRLWGDLRPGDRVFGVDGYPRQILARRDYESAPMVRVTFDDGSHVDCSTGHLWAVRGRQERRTGASGWRVLEACHIAELGVRRSNGVARAKQWQIPNQLPAQYPSRPVPIAPYTLGVWLGDGGRDHGSVTGADPEVWSRLAAVGEVLSFGAKQGTEAKTVGIRGLKPKLRSIGILDKYSFEKSVPGLYLRNDADTRAEVLRGLLDTDGECALHGSVVFSSCSRQLAEDVVWLARSLGGKARLQPSVKKPTYQGPNGERLNGRDCWRATIAMPEGFRCFYIARKQERIRSKEPRYLTRWIESIDPIPSEPAMCIEVVGQLYQAPGFVVTHNSALVGMLLDWGMSTVRDTRAVITANTENQLRTKTWPEVSKWVRGAINADWWSVPAMSFYSADAQHEKSWRADAIPWSENNTEAFAGLHNEGKRIILIFDEASKIADKVWEVAEGALTDEDTEIIWLAFGNPTQNTGRFRECFRRYRHQWITRQIDSRTVEGTNKAYLDEFVATHGEDSDIVKVRVRGQFPSQSVRQFISSDDVDAAKTRHYAETAYNFAPKILTCDPAWEGDDELVIGLRQGLVYRTLLTLAKNDNDVDVAAKLARLEDEHEADAVFVDAGYGTGIVSAGKAMGRKWTLVWFSGESADPGCLNKRAEMWKLCRDWLKQGGAIDPSDQVLSDDLTAPETVARLDGKIQIESKKDMKARGLPSPNRADALCLSFAFPVRAKDRRLAAAGRRPAYARMGA